MTVPRACVVADGVTVSFREAGTGPAVVLVPGLGLSGRFYEASYDAFAAAGLRLIVPDLPGSGSTGGARTGSGAADTARFVTAFADALGVTRATLVGHSLGAQAVVEAATLRPELAAAVVLVGPTGGGRRRDVLRQLAGLGVEATRVSRHVLRGVARDYLRTSPARYLGTWLRHARHDMIARAARVHCRALVLVGERDPVSRPDFVARLAQRLPDARVVRVPGGTHALPRGSADAFNRAVIEFVLNEADPR